MARLRETAIRIWLAAAMLFFATVPGRAADEHSGGILAVTIDGAIGIAAERQITGALQQARTDGARYLLIRMDTPGGLVTSTRTIIRQMLAAPIPIIVYVAPSGARAASAGTYILYASHIAAMAPGTNLGAATPISLGMPGTAPQRQPGENEREQPAPNQQGAAEQKAVNDAVAMMRSLAQLRGRNVEFAERAVREAATLTAQEALAQRVIEAVARDEPDLLPAIHGRRVTIGNAEHVVDTRGLEIVEFEPDWRTRVLGVIADPNIAFILLLVGVYGLFFEFMNPGALVPGVIGGISLVLALTALSTLPVEYAAIGLLLLGIALMTAEMFTPGLGILGIGGVVAFIAGGAYLFDPAGADIDIAVAWPVLIGAAAMCAGAVFFGAGAAMRVRRQPAVAGGEGLLGSVGRIIEWHGTSGRVHVQGEIWSAHSDHAFAPGDEVRVSGRSGLTLVVKPA